jgi:hypothetical protein
MKIRRPRRLPLLEAALEMEAPLGLCIHRSAAFVFDAPGSILVFGTIQPVERSEAVEGDSAVPFIHCWAEYRGHVIAPTTIERTGGKLCPLTKAGYYAINGVCDVHTLTRPQLLALDRQHGLRRALRLNTECRSGASFGGTLLDAAGVAWKDYGDGGVVPIYVEDLENSA